MNERIDVLAVIDIFLGEHPVEADHPAYKHDLVEARAAVAELIADLRQARAALSQNATYPADVALARTALDRALARVGGAA